MSFEMKDDHEAWKESSDLKDITAPLKKNQYVQAITWDKKLQYSGICLKRTPTVQKKVSAL